MGIPQIIEKKRDGGELSREEIEAFVSGYALGQIPEYQASALLMAIYFQGMGFRETLDLTQAMISSGERVDLSELQAPKIDKHSTGGVGDKVSLILAPLAASCGLVVPMISGRGLGHTGGTLDKLESIPGFKTDLSLAQFKANLEEIGVSIIAQSEELVPADRKLYALRNVSGTVPSPPLIAASIMSKKIAEGVDSLVLDVKVGRGALTNRAEDARELADLMIRIGRETGVTVVAILTSADQPLGRAVGNSLEVREAISVLKGEERPEDLLEVTLQLGSYMLLLGEKAPALSPARSLLEDALQSEKGLSKLRGLIEHQSGDPAVIEEKGRLPKAELCIEVRSPEAGYLRSVDALEIGLASNSLGAGRRTLDEEVDHSVGIVFDKKVGDGVSKGERVALIHANDRTRGEETRERVERALRITRERADRPRMVLEILGEKF